MGLKAIIFEIFKIKKATVGKKLEGLVSPEEKLEAAEVQLQGKKDELNNKSVEIIKAKKKTNASLNLEKKRLQKTEELLNKLIKKGDDEAAKNVFVDFESLQSSVAILEKANQTAEENEKSIQAAVSSINSRIRMAKSRIKSVRNLRNTQEITKLVGVTGIDSVNKFIQEIENYIKDQQWEAEAKLEVAKWSETSDKIDAIETDCELDEASDRFEAYKKSQKNQKNK